MDAESNGLEKQGDRLGRIELVIDMSLLLSPAEEDKLAANPWSIVPDAWLVSKIAALAGSFPEQAVFVAMGLSQKADIVSWLLEHRLFRKFGIASQDLLFFDKHVRMQQRILLMPSCRYVVSGDKHFLGRLSGLKPMRCLFAPSGSDGTVLGDGLLKGVFAFAEWETLLTFMGKGNAPSAVSDSALASAGP